jgi:hypothetical protein
LDFAVPGYRPSSFPPVNSHVQELHHEASNWLAAFRALSDQLAEIESASSVEYVEGSFITQGSNSFASELEAIEADLLLLETSQSVGPPNFLRAPTNRY